MTRTPGLIVPSAYSSEEEFEKDLRRRSEAAGFTPFEDFIVAHFSEDDFVEQMDAASEFLSHYGVKGMKWGRRKSGLVREAPSEDAQRVGGIHGRVKAQKSTTPLTNKELKDAIERMQLEQQYSKMSGGLDKTRRQKAAAFISEMITGAGKQLANEVTRGAFKDAYEKHTSSGRYDPLQVAQREAQLKKLRQPSSEAQS